MKFKNKSKIKKQSNFSKQTIIVFRLLRKPINHLTQTDQQPKFYIYREIPDRLNKLLTNTYICAIKKCLRHLTMTPRLGWLKEPPRGGATVAKAHARRKLAHGQKPTNFPGKTWRFQHSWSITPSAGSIFIHEIFAYAIILI